MPHRSAYERLWEKVTKQPGDGCWEWTGASTTVGYGRIVVDGRLMLTHRLAWLFEHGREPVHLVMHRCDNPRCVRPSHLKHGTHADNMRDKAAKGRAPAIRNGEKLRGTCNGNAKLTDDDVRQIRHEVAGGAVQREVARRFGLGQAQVSRIVKRRRWAHVT